MGRSADDRKRDDEVERLVRPAPKYKPPRHDRRRERVNDKDPDLEDKDPDLSLNYKDIGGSVKRVLERYAREEYVVVRQKSKPDSKPYPIPKRTLQKFPGKYEIVEQAQDPKPQDPSAPEKTAPAKPKERKPAPAPEKEVQPEAKPEAKPEASEVAGTLRGLAEKDPKLEAKIKDLLTPGRDLYEMAKSNPSFPAAAFFPGIELPDGASTLGDVQKALNTPVEKPKAKPKPKEPTQEPEAKGVSPTEAPQETREESKETTDSGRVVKRWLDKKLYNSPKFKQFLDEIPTSLKDASGQVLVLNPKTKKRVPFEELDPESQKGLVNKFLSGRKEVNTKRSQERAVQKLLDSVTDPDAKKVISSLVDKNSDAFRRVQEMSKKADLSEVHPEKLFPELRGKLPAKIDSVSKLAEIAAAHQAWEAKPEREKAGVGEPSRRPVTPEMQKRVAQLVVDTFPPDIGKSLLAKNLHPDDLQSLVSHYNASKVGLKEKSIEKLAESARDFFQTDPDRVKPPKKWFVTSGKSGEDVPFDSLSPSAKAEALREHQLQVVALSLAAQEKLTYELSMPSWTNEPRVPRELASVLARQMLRGGDSRKAASQVFDQTLGRGTAVNVSDRVSKALLKRLDPGAREVATAFFEANDYAVAKERFLKEGSFTEYDSPRDIYRGLKKVEKFFSDRKQVYGSTDRHKAAPIFRNRVLEKLRTLAPDRFASVRLKIDEEEASLYDVEYESYQRRLNAWKEKQKRQTYRNAVEPEPEPPQKPDRYDLVRPDQAKKEAASLLRNVIRRVKTAKQFTYPGDLTMASNNRSAVYHGQEPYEYGPEAYPEFAPSPPRDLDETDPLLREGSEESSCFSAELRDMNNPVIRLRQMAERIASSHPVMAFELVNLADSLERQPVKTASSDDRYEQLRSLVVRTAAADADAKRILMPVLQTIKALGK